MENWKRALIAGGAGLGVVMLLRGNKTAAMVMGGVSLATLASEYPETFAHIRRNLEDYVEQGTNYMDIVMRVGERLALAAENRGSDWLEALAR